MEYETMVRAVDKPNREELAELYGRQGETLSSVSRAYGTTHPTVRKWLRDYDISIKSHREASAQANSRNRLTPPSRETIERLYLRESKTIRDLQKIFSVGQETIYLWLQKYEIETKDHSTSVSAGWKRRMNSLVPSREELVRVYEECSRHLGLTSERVGLSPGYLREIMKNYKIEIEKPWRSCAEISLFESLIDEHSQLTWRHSDRSIINPFELDIVCDEAKLAIEYCGLYWHSEHYGQKDKQYHRQKLLKCREKGYDLFTVFETDDLVKVRRRIRHRVTRSESIMARKLQVEKVNASAAREFHNEYHMSGFVGGKEHLALVGDRGIVMLVTFGKARYSSEHDHELLRMTLGDVRVVGGFEKLLSHFKRENSGSIMTFADLRFGTGAVYQRAGFRQLEDSPPGYYYFNKNDSTRLYSRVALQKHRMNRVLSEVDLNMTEYENALANGWDRIWDCGHARFVLE